MQSSESGFIFSLGPHQGHNNLQPNISGTADQSNRSQWTSTLNLINTTYLEKNRMNIRTRKRNVIRSKVNKSTDSTKPESDVSKQNISQTKTNAKYISQTIPPRLYIP